MIFFSWSFFSSCLYFTGYLAWKYDLFKKNHRNFFSNKDLSWDEEDMSVNIICVQENLQTKKFLTSATNNYEKDEENVYFYPLNKNLAFYTFTVKKTDINDLDCLIDCVYKLKFFDKKGELLLSIQNTDFEIFQQSNDNLKKVNQICLESGTYLFATSHSKHLKKIESAKKIKLGEMEIFNFKKMTLNKKLPKQQ